MYRIVQTINISNTITPNFVKFKSNDVPAEEIWCKYGLGQVLRGSFEETCDGVLDMIFRHLNPVFMPCSVNGSRRDLCQVDAG